VRPFKVLEPLCTGCGLCVKQCSRPKILIENKKARVTDSEDCIACGHCYAVCPERALLAENGLAPEPFREELLKPEALLNLFERRRSHRRYRKTEIPPDLMAKLEEFARSAPTGTNARSLQIIWITGSEAVSGFTAGVMAVYARLKKLMNNPVIRFLAGIFDRRAKNPALRRDLNRMVARYERGEDPIFHSAPAVVLICAPKHRSSTPADDACYALYQMVLGAETLGLSSCLNGLAMIGLKLNKKLRISLGLTGDLNAYACAGFGFPETPYAAKVFHAKWLSKTFKNLKK